MVGTVRGHLAHALYRSLQIRFGVDEKLAGHDDAVAVANALANLRLAVAFDARLDVGGREAPSPLGDDDDGTLASPDHSFARHEHGVSSARRCEVDGREHARDETAARVRKFDARLERSRG